MLDRSGKGHIFHSITVHFGLNHALKRFQYCKETVVHVLPWMNSININNNNNSNNKEIFSAMVTPIKKYENKFRFMKCFFYPF